MTFAVSKDRLLSLVTSFSGRRLVVAGDYVLDHFVYGHPKRISREAPVLILRFWKEESLPGGAGNTAANVRALGGVPLPVGAVGEDEAGRRIKELFEERGISTEGLVSVAGYGTPTKTRILAGAVHSIKQQIVRLDREGRLAAEGAVSEKLGRSLEKTAAGSVGAVISDYGYGAVSKDVIPSLRRLLPPGCPVLVDSRHDLGSYTGADALTPNEEELEECSGQPLGDSVSALERAAGELRRRTGCPLVVVTRGSRGMALLPEAEPPSYIPVHGTDQVADVTGAGDTVLATFSLALASGSTPLEAALLANFAGGLVVMKMGTAVVTPDELKQAITSDRLLLGREAEGGRG